MKLDLLGDIIVSLEAIVWTPSTLTLTAVEDTSKGL